MLQYDMTIVYILGKDNTVADADSTFPGESNGSTDGLKVTPLGFMKLGINATLVITVNPTILQFIQEGYQHDDFCKKVISTAPSTLGIMNANNLWYISDHLLIPCFGTIQEDLFCLAHGCYDTGKYISKTIVAR